MNVLLTILKTMLPGIGSFLAQIAGPLAGFFVGRKTQKMKDELSSAEAQLEIRRESDAIDLGVEQMSDKQVDDELSKWDKK